MKIQIKEIRSGKIKFVDKRSADILVKLKKAEYYEDAPAQKGFYQTKTMEPGPASMAPISEMSTDETENTPLDEEQKIEDTEPAKRRGRPAKNKYETKVMIAEE